MFFAIHDDRLDIVAEGEFEFVAAQVLDLPLEARKFTFIGIEFPFADERRVSRECRGRNAKAKPGYRHESGGD